VTHQRASGQWLQFSSAHTHNHFRPLTRYQHYKLQNKKRLKMTRHYETINRSAHVNLHQILMFDSNYRRVLLMCQILLLIVKVACSIR